MAPDSSTLVQSTSRPEESIQFLAPWGQPSTPKLESEGTLSVDTAAVATSGTQVEYHPSYAEALSINDMASAKTRSSEAERILRTAYSERIIESLDWLADSHESGTDSLPYVQLLLEYSQRYFNELPETVYASFLSAVYDSLVLWEQNMVGKAF